jgi:hypothetical protein
MSRLLASILLLTLLACESKEAKNERLDQSQWKAPWRGTAWDNPDSIRVGLARGQCWPLVEHQAEWEACVKKSEKADESSTTKTPSPR